MASTKKKKLEKTEQQTFFDSLPIPYWNDQWDPDKDTKGIQQKESRRIWRQKRERYEATYKKPIQERLADMEERRPKWEAIHRKLKQDLGL